MIKRLLVADAASRLDVDVMDLLFAASDGEFLVEVRVRGGYSEVTPASLKRGLICGFVAVGENRIAPPPKGASHFEIIKTAKDRVLEWQEEISLYDLYLREESILKDTGAEDCEEGRLGAPLSEPTKVLEKPTGRLEQQRNTLLRDEDIRGIARDILDSDDGDRFRKQSGRINKIKLTMHIFGKRASEPRLQGKTVTRDTVRKALVNLKEG